MGKTKSKYVRMIIEAGCTIEIINHISGRLGSRGNGTGRREKPSEDKVKKWQDKRAEDKCRWLLNTNFVPGDLWLKLGWPPRMRKNSEKIRADIREFLKQLRKAFKAAGRTMKYIFSVGRGECSGIHIHMVINRFPSGVIEKIWQDVVGTKQCPYPSVYIRHLDRMRYYPKVAAYIIKNAKETFHSVDRIYNKRYCTTRNLRQPKIKRMILERGHWMKTPREKKGYFLDKDSIRDSETVNGYPYQSYTLVRLQI